MKIRTLYFVAALSVGCGSSVQPGIVRSPGPSTGALLGGTSAPETRSNVFASNGSGVRRIDGELLSAAHD